MRRLLKKRMEQALSSRALGRIVRHRVRDKRLILAYHGIIPEGATAAGSARSSFPSGTSPPNSMCLLRSPMWRRSTDWTKRATGVHAWR